MAVGTPSSKLISIVVGVSGASSIATVRSYASAGAAAHGSSRIPHSFARPQRFSSIEYGLALVIGTGILLSLAY